MPPNDAEQANRLASYHFTERVADDWSQNAADRYIMNKRGTLWKKN